MKTPEQIERIKEYQKKYREENKLKHKELNRLWYVKNKDKVKEQVKNYQKLRKSKDPTRNKEYQSFSL